MTRIGKLLKTYERKEGAVKDLAEKVKSGEITPSQAKNESKRRGINVDNLTSTPFGALFGLLGMVGFFLCIVPTVYYRSKMVELRFCSHFQPMEFPFPILVTAIAIAVAVFPLMHYSTRLRKTVGGCESEDYTVNIITQGPYSIMRHPTHFTVVVWLIAGFIIISPWIYFTLLSVLGIIMIVLTFYLMEIQEEKFNQVKFGDQYRQYMKDVPRWNLIKGLWNQWKRS